MNQKLVLIASLLACLGADKDRAPQKCQSASLTSELKAGNEFHRAIGGGLMLRLTYGDLRPNQNVNLWNIEIEPATSSKKGPDYIYPVNLPLRFNPLQTLGATYGESAKTLLSYPHEMWFLLSKDDYDKLLPKLDHALWPYTAPDPDRAGEEYLAAVNQVRTGKLVISVISYDLMPGSDWIRRMKFQAKLIAPENFRFMPELKSKPDTCPGPPQ